MSRTPGSTSASTRSAPGRPERKRGPALRRAARPLGLGPMAAEETIEGAAGPYAYRSLGAGPPLLLVNGYAGTSADWDPAFLEPLASERTVICPDHRGMGGSAPGHEEVTVESMAADVLRLMDALAIERAPVAGWSMGAFVAQALARA